METIIVPAMTDALEKVNTFVRDRLHSFQCPVKIQRQVELAVEEIFVTKIYPKVVPLDSEPYKMSINIAFVYGPSGEELEFFKEL